MNSLTFQNWDAYTLQDNDGFLNETNYQTQDNAQNKRKQLQSQISQTRDFINNTVKPAVDTCEAQTIVSADSNLTVTKEGTVTTLRVTVSPSGEATKSYVDNRDTVTLNSAKAYADEHSLTLSQVYPVGSIYMSINNTDPSTLFGGTWEQLKDRFLLGAGDDYTAGDTGGEATHTLTIQEMPSHSHNYTYPAYWYGGPNDSNAPSKCTGAASGGTSSTGGGQAHNNMPPYLAVYMWKRTA